MRKVVPVNRTWTWYDKAGKQHQWLQDNIYLYEDQEYWLKQKLLLRNSNSIQKSEWFKIKQA